MSIPATKTARKPEPWATTAMPKMHRTLARTRGAYRPSLGSGTRRMNASRPMPPATPTAVPTAICSANSLTTCQATPPAVPCAASSAPSSAIPTGSLAPDSPSSSTPVRPAISRRPNTENTTAGSVAATAVPTSRASRQSIPATKCAAAAAPAAVTRVPATPTQTMAAAAVRNRRQPMCIPPSNKMIASAMVTTRCTVLSGSMVARGHSCAATLAQIRKNAGAGTRSRALSRLDSTAAIPTRPITRTRRPKRSVPVIAADGKPSASDRSNRELALASRVQDGLGRGQGVDVENAAKSKNDEGSSIGLTLNREVSRPNWYMTSATRCSRAWSTPIG